MLFAKNKVLRKYDIYPFRLSLPKTKKYMVCQSVDFERTW